MRNIRTYAAYWWRDMDGCHMDGEEKCTEESYDGWSFRAVI